VNVTVPGALVVAVRVTDCPATAGLGEADNVVVVAVEACAEGTNANVDATTHAKAANEYKQEPIRRGMPTSICCPSKTVTGKTRRNYFLAPFMNSHRSHVRWQNAM
jgi:hypothetical protein